LLIDSIVRRLIIRVHGIEALMGQGEARREVHLSTDIGKPGKATRVPREVWTIFTKSAGGSFVLEKLMQMR
jgi:hypothetical protein